MSGLVTAEQVAVRAGLPLPLTDGQRAAINEALEDAYGQVAAYLGQSPIPVRFTENGVWPDGRGGFTLQQSPVVAIESATPEVDPIGGYPTGRYTVVYTAGLDPATDPTYAAALKRFVKWAAAHSPIVRRIAQTVPGARIETSVNVEGQGVTYESPPTAPGAAGEVPSLSELDPWRRLVVYQRPGIAPHPLESDRPWWY